MRFFQNLQNDGISPRAQIRLLDNTFMRLVFSFTAVPFVGIPFAIWIYLLGDELGPTITDHRLPAMRRGDPNMAPSLPA